jgi:hypothetical protein
MMKVRKSNDEPLKACATLAQNTCWFLEIKKICFAVLFLVEKEVLLEGFVETFMAVFIVYFG